MSNPRAALPPYPSTIAQSKLDVTLTIDTFVAEVPLDEHRVILVYHRQHGGRCYIRWRVFHKHRKGGNWYPDKRRALVIPIHAADAWPPASPPPGLARS